jgi:hypothetical protein
LGDGELSASYSGPLTGPLELQATGPLANALVAEQVSRANKTADRGWSEARCVPPRAEQWFVGAATLPGDTPILELANPTDTPAITDVSVFTPDGLSPTNAAHNLSLTPHSVVTVKLTDLAPGVAATAVRVRTTSGRVSAAVLDTRTSGADLLGTDWLPVTSPASEQTITGVAATVVGGRATRTLIVADPGDTDARVQVEVVTPQGRYVPVGLESTDVPAGTVKSIDLSKALGADVATVIVTSRDPTVPIVSTVLVDVPSSKGSPVREITYLGPNVPLRGAALVPIVYTAGDVDSVLVLSSPQRDEATSVTLVFRDVTGVLHQNRVGISPGITREISLRLAGVADRSSITVIPSPDSPPVYGVRLIEENGLLGPLISSFALVGAPGQQRVPQVVAEPLS